MLGPSQATLVALWVMLGGGRFVWRVLPTVLGVILYLWLFGTADGEWRKIVFGQICTCGVLLLVARLTGLELVQASDLPSDLRPFQFSIWDMLMWTTALAVLLSVLRCLPKDWVPSHPMPGFIVVFGSFALVAASSVNCSLGRRWPLAHLRRSLSDHCRSVLAGCGACWQFFGVVLCIASRTHGCMVARLALSGSSGRLSPCVAMAVQPHGFVVRSGCTAGIKGSPGRPVVVTERGGPSDFR